MTTPIVTAGQDKPHKPQVTLHVLGLQTPVTRSFAAEVIRTNRCNRVMLMTTSSERRYPARHEGTPGRIRTLVVKNGAGHRIARFSYAPSGTVHTVQG